MGSSLRWGAAILADGTLSDDVTQFHVTDAAMTLRAGQLMGGVGAVQERRHFGSRRPMLAAAIALPGGGSAMRRSSASHTSGTTYSATTTSTV